MANGLTSLQQDPFAGVPIFLRPMFIRGEILHRHYDDLLTAGLGHSGVQALTGQPEFAHAPYATRDELRRNAIVASHLGLIDRSPGAGYGTIYGPNIVDGRSTDDGQVAGDEYLAYASGVGDPQSVVTMMVQVPDSFDCDHPVILAAPSSGSRGIYGAVATVGDVGLKRGFAIAYTDKGTGIGAHDIDRNVAYLIDGEHADADAIGDLSHFRVTPEERRRMLGGHRFAFKHAHSQRNVEAHWGRDVLRSIEFAMYVLNARCGRYRSGRPFRRNEVTVIASSVSNGGLASLHAAEQDWLGWIDGVVVAEPPMVVQEDRSSPSSSATAPAPATPKERRLRSPASRSPTR